MEIKRGQVWYVDKNPTIFATGHEMYAGRPGVIVSCDQYNATGGTVSVVYLTTQPKNDSPYHVTVRSLPRNGTAVCEMVFTVDKSRLRDYYGKVSETELAYIDASLATFFGLDLRPAEKPDDIHMLVKELIEKLDAYEAKPQEAKPEEPEEPEEPEKPKIGDVMHKYYAASEMSLKELHEATGVSLAHIKRIVSGKEVFLRSTPSPSVRLLATQLGVPDDELFACYE